MRLWMTTRRFMVGIRQDNPMEGKIIIEGIIVSELTDTKQTKVVIIWP